MPIKEFSTLVELLQFRTANRPASTAFIFLANGEVEAAKITYKDLDLKARKIAALLEMQTRRADRALLLYQPGPDFIYAFFGCLYAGLVPVPAYPPDPVRLNRTMPRLLAIIEDAKPSVVLTTSDIL